MNINSEHPIRKSLRPTNHIPCHIMGRATIMVHKAIWAAEQAIAVKFSLMTSHDLVKLSLWNMPHIRFKIFSDMQSKIYTLWYRHISGIALNRSWIYWWCQALIWTNLNLLSIRALRIDFNSEANDLNISLKYKPTHSTLFHIPLTQSRCSMAAYFYSGAEWAFV